MNGNDVLEGHSDLTQVIGAALVVDPRTWRFHPYVGALRSFARNPDASATPARTVDAPTTAWSSNHAGGLNQRNSSECPVCAWAINKQVYRNGINAIAANARRLGMYR